MLFNKRLLQAEINKFDFSKDYDFTRASKIIGNWQTSIKNGHYDKTKETRVQASFLNLFFNIILGYEEMQDNPEEWQLINEAKTEFDGTKADGALGFFQKDSKQNITRAVIELKDAKTPLDKKQSTRKDYDSAVSQAFSYSSKFDRCDWIIVSNFKEIRLYHKDRGQGHFEEFKILELTNEKEFKRFYFLLCKENLLDKERNSLLDKLVKDTNKNEEDISKEFYKEFKALRQKLFQHICEHNTDINKTCLLEKTQKLLDRLIFIMFCEDSSNLLPKQTLKNNFQTAKNLPIPNDDKIWQVLKGLFSSIDKGNNDISPPINAYNGGLFAEDELLDNLIIKDDVWDDVIKLADYDFESDLNVNILGHIFEQSLSDLEQIKSEIEGVETDKKKSKRKKDGIFYTPEYITRYIVEQTVGKYLEEHPDKLENIKILDPACGSGAFINQAHTFLKEQYKIKTEEKIDKERMKKRGGQEFKELNLFKNTNIAQTDRSILLNNLFGVDLNEESTEITKLALWLKTARKDQPLQNLDNNIKCGNSLIDDAEVAGKKAFNWNEEFKEIMNEGGFDVVIGNPPYVRQELFSQDKPYLEKHYETYTGVSDLFVYFFEKGLNLLKDGGYFAFIVSNKFIKANYGKKLTQYLQKNYKILEIIDFGDLQIFEGATTMPCIITIKKEKPKSIEEINFLKLENLDRINDLKNEVNKKGYISEIKQNDESWLLINKKKNKILEKIKKQATTFEEIGININRGIVTGYNEAYVIDTKTKNRLCEEDPKSKEIIKPLLRGRDILPYYYNYENLWLINSHNGYKNIPSINVEKNYPIIYQHLKKFKEKLVKRYDKGNHWSNLRNCKFIEEFDKEKIIYPNMTSVFPFVYDENGYYTNQKCYILTLKHNNNKLLKTLTAYLNSNLSKFLLKMFFPELLGGTRELNEVVFKNFPIIIPNSEKQENLAEKADKMMELNKNLHEKSKQAIEFLKTRYEIEKTSQKLEKFWKLGVNLFFDELKKKKVKLSLNEQEELMQWYKDKQTVLFDLEKQINELDKEIDNEVYLLYGLTEEEIQTISLTKS